MVVTELAREFSRLKITMQIKPTVFGLNIIQTVITARKILRRVTCRDSTWAKFPLELLVSMIWRSHHERHLTLPSPISHKLRRLNPHRVHLQYKKVLIAAHNLHINFSQYNDIHNRSQSQCFFWMWFGFFLIVSVPLSYFSGEHSWSWPFQIHHLADAQLVLRTKPTGCQV